MALAIGTVFGMSFTRQVFVPFGGLAATGLNCYALGNESSFFTLLQPRDNASIFEIAPVANPLPFSPFGDLVAFTGDIEALDLYTFPTAPLTVADPAPQQAVIFEWFQFTAIGPGTQFAMLTIPQRGASERFIFALPQELSIIRRNPNFFPRG